LCAHKSQNHGYVTSTNSKKKKKKKKKKEKKKKKKKKKNNETITEKATKLLTAKREFSFIQRKKMP